MRGDFRWSHRRILICLVGMPRALIKLQLVWISMGTRRGMRRPVAWQGQRNYGSCFLPILANPANTDALGSLNGASKPALPIHLGRQERPMILHYFCAGEFNWLAYLPVSPSALSCTATFFITSRGCFIIRFAAAWPPTGGYYNMAAWIRELDSKMLIFEHDEFTWLVAA